MPDRTQEIKNLRAVATACKNYTDTKINDLRWELGTYDLGVDTVNGTTMLLPTPANTIQASMVRVDGASEVSENAIVLQDVAQTTINGITYSITKGVITLNGTATGWVSITLFSGSLSGTYTFKDFGSGTSTASNNIRIAESGEYTKFIPISNISTASNITAIQFYCETNTTLTNVVIKPMLIKGSTAPTEFKVGYDGIHNLELSGLKVEGANKLDNNNLALFGNNRYIITTQNVLILPNTTYTFSNSISNGADGSISILDESLNVIQTIAQSSANKRLATFTTLSNAKYFKIDRWYMDNTTFTIESAEVMLNVGSALPYEPYVSQTLPIDLTSIEDSGGNKLFADGSLKGVGNVTDEITPYKAIKKVARITISQWTYNPSTGFIRSAVINDAKPGNDDQVSNIISDKYETKSYNDMKDNHIIGIAMGDNKQVYIYTGEDISPTVDIEYEISTYQEANIDFSQLVKFEAHSNGSITLVNTNNQDTTSTFKYLKEVAK